MSICSCALSACFCQPAVAGGFIYADLRCELNIHLAPQALFIQSSPVWAAAASFPVSKHTGGGDTPSAFSGLRVYLQFTWEVGLPPSPVEFSSPCHFYKLSHSWLPGVCCCSCLLWPGLFIYSSRGKWALPLLLWCFPPSATFTSFPTPGCWARATAPAFSGLACLFTVLWGILLLRLQRSGHSTLFAICLYCCYCLLLSFSFLPWVGVSLSRGLCWSGPGLSVGVLHTT
jgi:hypothetical protein